MRELIYKKAIDIDRYGKNIQRQNALQKFGDHARVSQAMKGKTGMPVIPEYGFQTGLDFQEKFSGLDPKISAGLAAAYQTLQEGSRALNPFNPSKFLRFPTAMKTAQEQATKNIEGILASDTGTITPQQQAERNKYLASQGQPTDPVIDQSRISEIVEQQKAAGVPETGLITNFQQDTGSSVIPGFSIITEGDKTLYVGSDGQIYGPETYASIAAGMYPNIYDPNKQTLADGGRVGLFMGGPALEGQALNIYNSMNSYGFTDQQIADALQGQGLYTPSGSTQPEQVTGIINQQINQGGDDKPMIQSFKKDPRVAPAFEAFQADQQLQSMGIDNPFANEANLEGAYYGDMMNIDLSPGKQSKFAKVTEGLRSIPGKVKGMMDNPLTNAIGFAINPFLGGLKGIASFANQMLPVNKRAIAENVAGNMGISVDNIGRIVNTGNYQDPSNVMAGYNLNMLTDKSFDDRIETISGTLADKYDLGVNTQ